MLRLAIITQNAFSSHIKAHGDLNSAYSRVILSEGKEETLSLTGVGGPRTCQVGILIKSINLRTQIDALMQNWLYQVSITECRPSSLAQRPSNEVHLLRFLVRQWLDKVAVLEDKMLVLKNAESTFVLSSAFSLHKL